MSACCERQTRSICYFGQCLSKWTGGPRRHYVELSRAKVEGREMMDAQQWGEAHEKLTEAKLHGVWWPSSDEDIRLCTAERDTDLPAAAPLDPPR